MPDQGTGRTIERLKKGDKSRTARHADVMNELIDAINAIYAGTVTPSGRGKFIFSDSNFVLDLSNQKTIDLNVCIDGVPKVVTFVVVGGPRDP